MVCLICGPVWNVVYQLTRYELNGGGTVRGLVETIDRVNEGIGRAVAWLAIAIVLVQFAVVLGRYVFGIGSIWAQESVIYLHALMFMLAAAYTLKNDGHVRVDIFYREATPAKKALVDLAGAALLLLPVCILIAWVSRNYVAVSWSVLEGSKEASGIRGVFLLKTAIVVFALQMALQGISMAMHALWALGGDAAEIARLDASSSKR